MFVVRPSQQSDLAGIAAVIAQNRARVSSVPIESESLAKHIEFSEKSFARDPSLEGEESYLFVLEETDSGRILGTSGIRRNNLKSTPFYSYRIDELIHSSERLGVHNIVPVLHLTHELTGATILCAFSIDSKLSDDSAFDLLSRARLLFIASNPDLFAEQIVVELQGQLDDHSGSPFWDSVGRHFFKKDFHEIDRLSSTTSRTVLAEMMPVHPIYVNLLLPAAKQAIGEISPGAEVAKKILEAEGFVKSPYIDIFDGGPTYLVETSAARTHQDLKTKSTLLTESNSGHPYLVGNRSIDNFRCGLARINDGLGDIVRINADLAEVLLIKEKSEVVYAPV